MYTLEMTPLPPIQGEPAPTDEVVEQTEKITRDIDDLRMSFDHRLKGLEATLAEIAKKLDIPTRK